MRLDDFSLLIKKYGLSILFLTSGFFLRAQQPEGGKVIYSKELIEFSSSSNEKTKSIGDDVRGQVQHRMKTIKNSMAELSYVLQFNRTQSTFELQEFLRSDGKKFSDRAVVMGEGDGVFYVDLSKKEIVHKREFYGEDYLVKDEDDIQWEITSERKKIGEFSCRKAIAKRQIEIIGKDLKPKVMEVQEIAWFCPEIPFSFGPIGRNGLPGLILELEVRNIRYEFQTINFSHKKVHISEPVKGKVVSGEEFEDIISKVLYRISDGKLGEG